MISNLNQTFAYTVVGIPGILFFFYEEWTWFDLMLGTIGGVLVTFAVNCSTYAGSRGKGGPAKALTNFSIVITTTYGALVLGQVMNDMQYIGLGLLLINVAVTIFGDYCFKPMCTKSYVDYH